MATGYGFCFDDFRKQCRGTLEWYNYNIILEGTGNHKDADYSGLDGF